MDPENVGAYEVVPVNCFACAARDRENRAAAEARSNNAMADSAFDGLYFAVTRHDH